MGLRIGTGMGLRIGTGMGLRIGTGMRIRLGMGIRIGMGMGMELGMRLRIRMIPRDQVAENRGGNGSDYGFGPWGGVGYLRRKTTHHLPSDPSELTRQPHFEPVAGFGPSSYQRREGPAESGDVG
ncbi:hypothetical protein M231_05616 [Tremella mesenterica]|uniref:Uncharacterized protein n=1 Tax=Tremella mesenterica TaxID=5217 RepID=A0A4Q1BHM8_TREME|nr:hypothetical protein M231_05616 [Tremella mesenterica]